MARIKLTQDQLKKLISEETVKYKKVLALQKQKEEILSQLKEINEENSNKK